MTIEYLKKKLNLVVNLMAAAVPDVVSFCDQINTSLSIWFVVINLENNFSLLPIRPNGSNFFFFCSWQIQNIFTLPPQGYINPSALCLQETLSLFSVQGHWSTTLIIDKIFIGPRDSCHLYFCGVFLQYIRRWEINLIKIQHLSTSVQFE